uniref:Uncharacterized protein n=1 Tax=Anguilla anguilla TaxID=7936 RepID=A0A0E9S4S1_ANGAN
MMHTIKVGSQKLHKQLHSYKLHMYFKRFSAKNLAKI